MKKIIKRRNLISQNYSLSSRSKIFRMLEESTILPPIWLASSCTLAFSNRSLSFDKSRRFQFNSIYYKDDPFKLKNQQNPFSRPEMILNEFRKKIKQASKTLHTKNLKKKKKVQEQDNAFQTLSKKASDVVSRLYQSPRFFIQLKFDQNGSRSSFYEQLNKNEKQNYPASQSVSPKDLKFMKMQHKQSSNSYITSTHRSDFSKPLNFNPGPGSYIDLDRRIIESQKDKILKKSANCLENRNSVLSLNKPQKKFSLSIHQREQIKVKKLNCNNVKNDRRNNLQKRNYKISN